MSADPRGTIARYAGLLDVDAERVRHWLSPASPSPARRLEWHTLARGRQALAPGR